MEVISLNERERSTTILNTTPPSDDTADGLDDLALDNGENVTPFDNDYDDSTIAADDSEAATANAADAANTGVWTKKNKLLASIIAGTALLCAVGAGGGVAAHNARMNAAKYCPAPVAPPPVDGINGGGGAKAAKSASGGGKAGKAVPCVCLDTDDDCGCAPLTPEEEVAPPLRRVLLEKEQEEVVTPIGGEGAYYHIPKVVEDKRKNRMLAEHLGHRAVVTSSFSWGDYLNGVKFGFGGGGGNNGRRLGLEDVVSEVEEIGGGEEEVVTVGETEDPSVVAATGGGSKGSKSGSGGTKGSKSGSGGTKAAKGSTPQLGEGVQCKCDLDYIGSIGTKAAKSGSPAGTAKSGKAESPSLTVDAAAPVTATKSAKSGSSPSTKAGKASSGGLAPTACGNIGGQTPSSKSVKEPPTPSVPAVPSPPVSPPATVTKAPTEPVVKPPCEETDEGCEVPVPPVPTEPAPTPPTPTVNPPTPATEPNPPTPPVNPPTPATEPNPPTPPTDPSPTPPTSGSGGGEPNCENDEDWISTNKKTCADLANDAGLCDTEVNDDGDFASDACPASCNEDCFEGNCDNDDDWASTNGENCEDVANDTGLCDTAESAGGVSASDACPKSCNPECTIPVIPVPVGSPTNPPITLETYKPTAGSTVTVGDPESSAPTGGSRGETEPPTPSSDGIAPPPPTPMPTGLSTSLSTGISTGTASFGGTVTVSTETTGPLTTELRPCGEDGQGDCDQ